jgi:hypothetical protein
MTKQAINGIELLRRIKDDELKYGTKIKNIKTGAIYVYYDGTALWRIEENKELEEVRISVLVTGEFEIIEEDEEIDIQAIEEINFIVGDDENDTDIANKVNELIKAVKQLDKKIKEGDK